MKTVIITESPGFWKKLLGKTDSIEFKKPNEYLTQQNNEATRARIINLCGKYSYQSIGYYISLLGQARGDKVSPSVLSIQDFNTNALKHLIEKKCAETIKKSLKTIISDKFELSIYFGNNIAKQHNLLSRKIYNIIPVPLFRVYFKRNKNNIWHIFKIYSLNIKDIPEHHIDFLSQMAKENLLNSKTISRRKLKTSCSIAMLTNPHEKQPPSNKTALAKFIKAGKRLGINVIPISKDNIKILPEFDGLFIRETTAVNNHTYQFARRAIADDLISIDDPLSILRCSNKVYLADMLEKAHIKTPATKILFRDSWKSEIDDLSYPIVLKKPDSAFSIGVIKVETKNECIKNLVSLFKDSELIIAQQYMPSEFDWRIGIIDNKPLFACKYFMAKDHWQIYNWNSKKNFEGKGQAVSIENVPKKIMSTALKACKSIGDGLYGVDIKYVNNTPYVIEINDNPNIDHKIEDAILGDELYLKIMNTFLTRIRAKFYGK